MLQGERDVPVPKKTLLLSPTFFPGSCRMRIQPLPAAQALLLGYRLKA